MARPLAGLLVSGILLAAPMAWAGGRPDAPVDTEARLQKRTRLHFEIWNQQGLDSGEVDVIRRHLHEVRADVGRELGVDPSARFDVIVTDAEVFRGYSGAPVHVAGMFDGKIHIPLPSRVDETRLKAVLWHEYAHAVIVSKTRGRCPSWLNEGIAEYQEAKIDGSSRRNLSRLVGSDGHLPFSWDTLEGSFRFRSASPERQALAYLQAFAIADYLFGRFGSWRIERLLDAIGETGDVETALRQTMRLDLDRLEREVVRHVR